MDIVLISLRLLHIVSAFAWIGLGATSTLYIAPTAIASGESGLRFLKFLLTRTSFGSAFGIAAGLTTLAGLALYAFAEPWTRFSSTGNIVLGIGAVAGILATLHGGAATGRATRALGDALAQHIPENTSPLSTEALLVLREHAEKLLTHSRISFVLMLIALIGMGSARYL